MNIIEADPRRSASPAAPTGLDSSGSGSQRIDYSRTFSRRRFIRSAVFGVGGLASAALVGCGGADADASAKGVMGTRAPAAPINLTEPTAVVVVATEAPKAASALEPLKLLSPSEITSLVDSALENIPDSNKKANTKSFVRQAEGFMSKTGEASAASGAVNQYGNAAQWIVQYACENPDSSKLAEAFFAIRDVSLNLIKEQTEKGVFAPSSAGGFARTFFQIPNDCKNPYLFEGKSK